jgi:hypothetical protein
MFKDGAEAGLWGDLPWDRGADESFLKLGSSRRIEPEMERVLDKIRFVLSL